MVTFIKFQPYCLIGRKLYIYIFLRNLILRDSILKFWPVNFNFRKINSFPMICDLILEENTTKTITYRGIGRDSELMLKHKGNNLSKLW